MAPPPPSGTLSPEIQRIANDITATLAQLAKEPPPLATYLQAHASCLSQSLQPRGFCYEMLSGAVFTRVYGSNLGDISFPENQGQEEAFKKTVRQVAQDGKPIVLQPNTPPPRGIQSLTLEEAASTGDLPLFNLTAYQHYFVAIPLDTRVAGVLHVWFTPTNELGVRTRLALLTRICSEVALYLRSRKLSDISQELSQMTTYVRLLENLAGDIDLQSTSWNLVNYARESLGCERVSILVAQGYPKRVTSEPEFELLATSGLRKPNVRSEQARALGALAGELSSLALNVDRPAPGELVAPARGSSTPDLPVRATVVPVEAPAAVPSAETPVTSVPAEPAPAPKPVVAPPQAPTIRLAIVTRKNAETAKSETIRHYFETVPMNWVTALPLLDQRNEACGLLLFEGTQDPSKVKSSFTHMRELAVAGGRALGTSLYWHGRTSLRAARWIAQVSTHVARTPTRRLAWKIGAPIAAALAILLFPLEHRVHGNATLRPVTAVTVPALVAAPLQAVDFREGQTVTAGQVLARLDTRETEFQLRQAEQDAARFMAEANSAVHQRNEAAMQMARASARRAEILAENLRGDLERAVIRAPFDGVVTGPSGLHSRIGQVIRLGEPVVELARADGWEVRIELREQDIHRLEQHLLEHGPLDASIKFVADPTRTLQARLETTSQLAYGLTTQGGSYRFAAVLPLPADAVPSDFRLGYSGKTSFSLGRQPLAYVLFSDFIRYLRVRSF